MRSRRSLPSCPNSAGWWRDAQTPQSQFGIATASTLPEERLKRREVSLNVDVANIGGPMADAIEGAAYQSRMVSMLQYVYAFGFLHL